MKNNDFIISTALNYNIANKRMDYNTFSIYHIVEHCLVSFIIKQSNDYRIYSRISGKTNNYNLNLEINTLTARNEVPFFENLWKQISTNAFFDYALFDEQKNNVVQEIKKGLSPYKKCMISINNIISNESLNYPSVAQIESITYDSFVKAYSELISVEKFISMCYGQETYITKISDQKNAISIPIITYSPIYFINTDDDSSGSWMMFLTDTAKSLDEFIFNEIVLNCLNYLLKYYLKDNESEFIVASKCNDNIAAYILLKIDELIYCQEKIADFFSSNNVDSILDEKMYLNLVDDLKIFLMFLMENCRSRNGMIQKLHCCFCEYQQDNLRNCIEKILYSIDRSRVISTIVNMVNKTIKFVFSNNNTT